MLRLSPQLCACADANVACACCVCGRVGAHMCAIMCACMHVLAMDMCWRTQACECQCECRTSAVLSGYLHRCSANYETIAELLSPVRFKLVVDDFKPASPYAPDSNSESHATITNCSPSTRAQRIWTRDSCDTAIEATQETAWYRSAADQRRQRICAQAAHTLDATASLT